MASTNIQRIKYKIEATDFEHGNFYLEISRSRGLGFKLKNIFVIKLSKSVKTKSSKRSL